MTCGHCVGAVTEEVGALDGVTDVRVDLGTGEVDVASTRPLERELVARPSSRPATSWWADP